MIEEIIRNIIRNLENRGYHATEDRVVKNGIEKIGITIGTGNIRPIIYVDEYINKDVDWIVDKVISIYEEAKTENIDIEKITTWDYIKDNLQLCIQRKGTEDIVKRDFLDLEQYVRVIVDKDENGTRSFKVKPEMLEKYGITEDALFHAAIDCTRPLVEVQDMKEVLMLMGMDVEDIMSSEQPPMIVITNKNKTNGASSIYFVDVLREIADRYESDLAIIPSSIHECILYPVDNTTDFKTFDEMICEVNETQVAPKEVLSNHAYRFDRDECRITYYNRGESTNYHSLSDM